mmetsp:Transcript_38190/g.36555  ORF Transcript_38190/g.36555 Transcript_38190/m.36555 type:complete len:94 (+) Transcript_38190:478-759(+)
MLLRLLLRLLLRSLLAWLHGIFFDKVLLWLLLFLLEGIGDLGVERDPFLLLLRGLWWLRLFLRLNLRLWRLLWPRTLLRRLLLGIHFLAGGVG